MGFGFPAAIGAQFARPDDTVVAIVGDGGFQMTLCELGWQANLLGAGIPIESLVKAIEEHRPRLFWLSISTIEDESDFPQAFNRLSDACGVDTALVIGGRALDEQLRKQLKYTVYCEDLQRLAAFVQALKETRTPPNN